MGAKSRPAQKRRPFMELLPPARQPAGHRLLQAILLDMLV
jgi:hypothetical protein